MDHTSTTEGELPRFNFPGYHWRNEWIFSFLSSFSARSHGQTNSAGRRKDGDIWRNRRTHWRRVAEPRPEESQLIASGESNWFNSTEKLGQIIWAKTGQNLDWKTGKLETGDWRLETWEEIEKVTRQNTTATRVAFCRLQLSACGDSYVVNSMTVDYHTTPYSQRHCRCTGGLCWFYHIGMPMSPLEQSAGYIIVQSGLFISASDYFFPLESPGAWELRQKQEIHSRAFWFSLFTHEFSSPETNFLASALICHLGT
ncbi:uncharacterized protein N7496_011013 [Penicillium cataractarum]|uniref:Uncharacterized protein n=1 Tax=Penicillium cataractarum TaxID=2100454 RepID=A0A9W9UXB7_9EURO|nr:uncharacterized protein N7496_011013 [Penicillium cataractarum]KAJ5358600.1 hypothetical protein N7496_011013 [Penicillium cataractarum]